MASEAFFEKLLTGDESPNQIVVGDRGPGGRGAARDTLLPSPLPLANLANLTRWVCLKEFLLHEFPTKALGVVL